MTWDVAVSEFARQCELPGDIRKAVDLSEAFAHGSGCAVILLAILLSHSSRWRMVLLAGIITASSGLAANGAKAAFVRTRPNALNSAKLESSRSTDATIEFLGQGSFWSASHRSFPSGHAATAWGLAIALSLLYPRATVLYGVLASIASFQRLTSGAHYPSDIMAGTAIAFLIAAGLLTLPWSCQELWRDRLMRGLHD